MNKKGKKKIRPVTIVINVCLAVFFLFIIVLIIQRNIHESEKGEKYYEGYYYEILENGIVINSYEGTETEVEIPAEINGKNVTSIAQNCFSGNVSLEKVRIPGTVRGIGLGSFKGCIHLKEVVMEEGVEMIASYAFQNCKALETVDLPKSMDSIGLGAFEDAAAFTLKGYEGTASQTYAEENNIAFEKK